VTTRRICGLNFEILSPSVYRVAGYDLHVMHMSRDMNEFFFGWYICDGNGKKISGPYANRYKAIVALAAYIDEEVA
jgi:hypothetical protein